MVIGAAMSTPALAVVGADHQIIRSTETFRRKCDDPAALWGRAPELDLVLNGQTDTAVVELGDLQVAIEAVTDAAGKRQAMLSLAVEDSATDHDAPLAALRDAAADSAAIVWVKDLDGRYLYVNARFEEYLETSQERLLGNTDTDLPTVETVDGPRLRFLEEDGLEEPIQLEYTVPPYESRPAMAAFRFPLRNGKDQPIATCGVAAPNSESQIAGDEAVRLMQLERWNRLDPVDVRAELLEQWRVQATPGPAPEAELDDAASPEAGVDGALDELEAPTSEVDTDGPRLALERRLAPEPRLEPEAAEADPAAAGGDPYHREEEWVRQLRQAASISAADATSETANALQSDLQLARKWAERADQLQGDLQEAHARLLEAEAEAQQAAANAHLAADEAKRYRAEVEQAQEAALRAAAEVEQAREDGKGAKAEVAQAREDAKGAEAEVAQAREIAMRANAELEQAREALGQAREELEQERTEADAARSELEVARRDLDASRRELGAARAQAESLRGPSDSALRLSEELGRALAAERERGDELARVLARVRSRLGDLEGAIDRSKPPKGRG